MGPSSRAVVGPLEPSVGRLLDEGTNTSGPRGTYGCACAHHDGSMCAWIRYGGDGPEDPCECLCHGWPEDEAARIAGLTWGDVACAIRALGMPEASEDFVRVCRALHHVVDERGYDNAEELLESLDIAAECAEELRMPDLLSEREQADADARDRAERVYEARRDV